MHTKGWCSLDMDSFLNREFHPIFILRKPALETQGLSVDEVKISCFIRTAYMEELPDYKFFYVDIF